MVVRLLEERTFTPPRLVKVEGDGIWCPGFQRAWRLCDDDRGWVAHVEYVAPPFKLGCESAQARSVLIPMLDA